MRAWKLAAIALLTLFAVPATSQQNTDNKRYVLFSGDTDSTDQASPWIPIRGANRILIRTYSSHLAFGASNADSAKSDSIAVFRVLFSDSSALIVRDSAGTLVTLGPYTSVANRATAFPLAADSVMLTTATHITTDTTTKLVGVSHPPLQEQLRAPANGSGIYTVVYVTAPSSVSAYGDGSFAPRFMRVRVTPARRMTANTSTCTGSPCGNRVNGLRGLRMEAEVIYNRK